MLLSGGDWLGGQGTNDPSLAPHTHGHGARGDRVTSEEVASTIGTHQEGVRVKGTTVRIRGGSCLDTDRARVTSGNLHTGKLVAL